MDIPDLYADPEWDYSEVYDLLLRSHLLTRGLLKKFNEDRAESNNQNFNLEIYQRVESIKANFELLIQLLDSMEQE